MRVSENSVSGFVDIRNADIDLTLFNFCVRLGSINEGYFLLCWECLIGNSSEIFLKQFSVGANKNVGFVKKLALVIKLNFCPNWGRSLFNVINREELLFISVRD